MNMMSEPARFGSGRAVQRVEDAALLAGQGTFTDNVPLPGQTYIAFLRSPYAHARIGAIDTSAAVAMPGVLAVYTGESLQSAGVKPMGGPAGFMRPGGTPAVASPRCALAVGTARFVGEAVVAVVAESRTAARDAAEAVIVDFEDLPAVVDAAQAIAPGAPVLCANAPDNIAAEMRHGDAAATTAAFAAAAHTVQLDLVNQRLAPSPMEPRSAVAYIDGAVDTDAHAAERLTMRISSQMPTGVRASLGASIPGLTPENVRVLVGDVGGGFGMKTGIHPEDIVVAFAAKELKRPVRWMPTAVKTSSRPCMAATC